MSDWPHNDAGHDPEDGEGVGHLYAIDATKLETELGWRALENFDSGIEKTIDWYLENRTWWLRVMEGEYRQWISKHYSD